MSSCLICADRAERRRAGGATLAAYSDTVACHPETLVCGSHFYALYRLLDPANTGDPNAPETSPRSIPRLYALLSPARKTGTPDGAEPSGPPVFGSKAPIDVHQTAMRDPRSRQDAHVWKDRAGRVHRESENPPLSAQAVLRTWADRLVADPEYRMRPLRGPLGVDTLAAMLHTHLERVAARPWVVPFAAEIIQLSNQLRTAVQAETGEYRPRPFSMCPAVLDHTVDGESGTRADVVCGGDLFPPRLGDTITCHTCGSWWAFADWWPAQPSETSLAGAA